MPTHIPVMSMLMLMIPVHFYAHRFIYPRLHTLGILDAFVNIHNTSRNPCTHGKTLLIVKEMSALIKAYCKSDFMCSL